MWSRLLIIGSGQLDEWLARVDDKTMRLKKILVLVTLISAIWLIKIGPGQASPNTNEELNGRTWYLAGKGEINIEIIGRVKINPTNSPGTYFETITFTVSPAL